MSEFYYFKSNFWRRNIALSDIVDQDQTARSVQSDLDVHCLQKGPWVALGTYEVT